MSDRSPLYNLYRVGEMHLRAYNRGRSGDTMPPERARQFLGYLAANPDHQGNFGDRLQGALQWTRQNPLMFMSMVEAFDSAVTFLNTSAGSVDSEAFPNLTEYFRLRGDRQLPYIGNRSSRTPHRPADILHAAQDSTNKLHWGETILPGSDDVYGFHAFMHSNRGMVAASMTDLYENYLWCTGWYPADSAIPALMANAITEAAFIVDHRSPLFHAYRNPEDGWIRGYDGFSEKFQRMVYGPLPPGPAQA
ncbi:MAG TPA: hypothetical protein VLE99_06270 [Candidatus Saccharimonadales bacterium]|nr:hypothetical protein [Candidatus Saccharimonadales bacterium]HSX31494.1 hypothetical protein [Candidatus Saccharimonadales bacterium]